MRVCKQERAVRVLCTDLCMPTGLSELGDFELGSLFSAAWFLGYYMRESI